MVLAAVFLIGGPLIAVLIAKLTGLNSRMGWSSELYQLVVFFGLTAVLLIAWVVLFERRPLSTIGFNGQGLKRVLRGYAIGLGFLLATIGIIAAAGGYRVEGGGAFASAAVPAALLPIGALCSALSSRARPRRSCSVAG